MPQHITHDDLNAALRRFADDIKGELGRRIDGLAHEVEQVKGEWKATNGRVRTLEVSHAVLAQRAVSLEKETFKRPDADDGGGITITRKQLTTWIGMGTMAGAALVKLWPLLKGLGQ